MPDLVYNVKFQIDDASLKQASQATTTVTGGTGTAESTKRDAENTKKSIRQIINEYALLGKETDNVTRKLKSSSSGFTQFNSSTDATAGKLEGLRSDLLPVITALEGVANSTEATVQEQLKARTTLSQLIGVYDRASNASQAYAANQRMAAETMELVTNENRRMNASFSTSNQVLFSFSDGIQDASQFSYGFASGMRAIGNNIGFTGELFANLNRRVQEFNQTHGPNATSVTKELRNSLRGPAGMLLGLNLAITAFTVISREIEKYRKRAQEAAGSTSEFTSAIKQFYDISTGAGVTELSRLEKEVEFYERRIEILKEDSDLRKQYTSLVTASSSTQGSHNDILLDELNAIEEKITLNRELQNQFGIQRDDYDQLNQNLLKATSNYNAFTKGTSESEVQLGLFVARIKDVTTVLLNEYNIGLDDVNGSVDKQIEYLKNLRNSFILLAREGDTSLIPVLSEINKQINALTEGAPELTADVFTFDVEAFSASFNAGIGIISANAELFNQEVADQINGTMSLYQINEELLRNNLEASAGIAQEFSDQLDEQTEKSVDKRARLEWALAQRTRSFIEQLAIFEATRNTKAVEDLQIAKDAELAVIQKQYDDELILKEEFEYRKAQIEDRYNKSSDQLAETQLEMRLQIAQKLVSGFSDAYQALFGENKAVAIAETVISTYLAAQRSAAAAASLGPIASKLAAAAEIAAGIARVAKIKQTNINSSSINGENKSATFNRVSTLMPESGFKVSDQRPSYTPSSGSNAAMGLPPSVILNVDETGFSLYLKGIEGNLENDTMFMKSA